MSHKAKRILVAAILQHRQTTCFKNFYSLFQQLLKDARLVNDTAEGNDILKTQGEIKRLKQLLKDLNPNTEERIHYDGGFGE